MKIFYSKEFDQSKIGRNPNWKKEIADEQKYLAEKQKPFTDKIETCPICFSNKFSVFCKIFDYEYLDCKNCRHVYSSLKLNEKDLEKFYSSENSIKSAQSKIYINKETFKKRVENIAQSKAQFVNTQLKAKSGYKVWADIGCGVGELVYAAGKLGWNSIGYEIDKESVAFAKSMNLNVVSAKFDKSFDYTLFKNTYLMSLINVLEHVGNPVEFLSRLSFYCPHNSYIFFEVPRTPSLSSYLNKIFPNNSNRHIYPPDHLHIFSDKSIDLMLNKCGFEIESLWYFGQDFSDLFNNLALEGNIKDDNEYNNIFNLSGKFQKILDKEKLSDSVMVIAKKIK